MARQRAGDAQAAMARAWKANVGEHPVDGMAGDNVGIIASENESSIDVIPDSDGEDSNAGSNAGQPASRKAVRKTSRKAGKGRRRVGRPRGPERVPLTVRILAETDERLTAAVEATGKSPQYIVDEALSEYLARLERLDA